MSREEAVAILQQLINSGILSEDLEEKLADIRNCICNDTFKPCIGTEYCGSCQFRNKKT